MLKTGTTQIQTQKRKRIPGAETSVSARGGGRAGGGAGGQREGGLVEGAGWRVPGRGLAAMKAGEGGCCDRARPSSWGGQPVSGSRPWRRSQPGAERSRGALAAPEGGAHGELTPQGPLTPSPRSHWLSQSGGTGSPGISVCSDPTSRSPPRSSVSFSWIHCHPGKRQQVPLSKAGRKVKNINLGEYSRVLPQGEPASPSFKGPWVYKLAQV